MNTLPDPWAKSLGDAVAFAGGGKSQITSNGNQLQVVVRPVVNGVATSGNGSSKRVKRAALESAWKQLKGNPKGVVSGRTTGGKAVSIPVIFEPTIDVTKKRVTLTARMAKGDIDPKVEEAFPKVGAVEEEAIGSKFRFLSVVGSDHGSQAWRLTSATKAGRLSKGAGGSWRVQLNKAKKRGVGVQMNTHAGTLPWDYIQENWDTVSGKGAKPVVVISGIGRKNTVRTITVRPTNLRAGKKLVITGNGLTGLKASKIRAMRLLRGVTATLVSSNAGQEKSFVVVTGDSISSGESGRYLADYEGAGWFILMQAQQYEKFCMYGDLACVEAKATGDPGGTAQAAPAVSVDYEEKPVRVYEKGTQDPQECHRSYDAPGTWLARYYKVEQGQKVDSINIACSGATTEAVTERFNGQRPQADVLREISNFVHVPLVTNTMGANDIGFSAIAIGCYMGVADAFLNGDVEEGESMVDALMAQLPSLLDAKWNPWFGKRKVKGEKEFESYNPYCSDNPAIGESAEKKLKQVPGLYRKAMGKLLDAAPHAKVVAHNYPNLIPHNSQSNLPREQFFGEAPNSFTDVMEALTSPSSSFWAFKSAFDGRKTPAVPDFDTMSYEQLQDNQKAWANYFYTSIVLDAFGQSNSAFVYPIITTLNLLYAQDMNWAAWKLIPGLDDAVYETASSMGDRVIPVDMREVLNGREYTTAYKGAPGVPDGAKFLDDGDFFINGRGDTLQGMPHAGYSYDSLAPYDPTPDKLRASFVTAPLAGLFLEMPVLCPGSERGDLTVNGKEQNGYCLGSMNEPLHPNWRGQAAQGQCLVAVVSGMADGNACVRSIGSNDYSEPYSGAVWGFLKSVDGTDDLCVKAKPRSDYPWKESTPDKPYTECSSDIPADPTWDSERWQTVADHGNWK